MIRTLLICAAISASALGCTTTQQRVDTRTATATNETASNEPCVPTGSRIPKYSGQCSPSPGRVYSQADVERTGQVNVGEALQMLDPSITVHH